MEDTVEFQQNKAQRNETDGGKEDHISMLDEWRALGGTQEWFKGRLHDCYVFVVPGHTFGKKASVLGVNYFDTVAAAIAHVKSG